ncbi:MAG: hypothetical protein ACYSWZ_10040 [Planctomycetota bacterium]|jgi:hypothetical protein
MRRYYFMVLAVIYFAFSTGVPAYSAKDDLFSESALVDAFEKGRSLIIAEVLSRRRVEDTRFLFYKVKVIRPIIPGDLTKADLLGSVELFAGTTYGADFRFGSTYAMFVKKDCPFRYSWAHRDDVIEVDISRKEDLQALVETAGRIYEKTSISKFREKVIRKADLPPLSKRIISLCDQFKTDPEKRADIGRQLYESDLGSRRDESKLNSSENLYLPPKVSLSRDQILSLLGRPNLKRGWTYFWLCGQIGKGSGAKKVGVLSATFNKNEAAVRVLYKQHEKSKWTKFAAYSINSYVDLCGWADAVLYRFQLALKESNWERALSLCSKPVRAKAKGYGSAGAFFKDYMPIEKITELSGFPVRSFSGRAGKITSLSFYLRLEEPEAEWPISWECSVVKEDGHWLVNFKALPVKILIKKELLRRELEKEDAETRMAKFDRDIEFRLIPLTEEFEVGLPMLFRIEMVNVGGEPILYRATGPTAVVANDRLNITGPNGKTIQYVDTSYQIAGWPNVILPDETIVLVDNYDVVRQYNITRPGRYTFQFKGWSTDTKVSNTIDVEVRDGELTTADSVFARVRAVMPGRWKATRRLVPAKQDSGSMSGPLINVHMVGKRRGKSIDVDILLLIAEDEGSLDTQYVSKLKLWGKCKWGNVYFRGRNPESLWPDYRKQIIKALGIEEIKTD